MEQLPIRSLTLYKQGIGVFERRGTVEGNSVSLALPRAVTNDVLKSLTVTVVNGGPLQSVEYPTPATTAQLLRPLPLTLGERSSLLDLLASIRGSAVSLQLLDETTVSGRIVGVEATLDATVQPPSVLLQREDGLAVVPLAQVRGLTLHDQRAAADLAYVLDMPHTAEQNNALTLRFPPGHHELQLHYLAPSPTWRVSYRLVGDGAGQAHFLGYALWENTLDEDLVDVELTLMSGRPISFEYTLVEGRIPKRPQVADEPSALDQLAGSPLLADSLATIGHELRTPLTTINGYATLLERDTVGPLTPEQRSFVQTIRQGAERMQTHLNSLLNLLRLKDEGQDLTPFLVQGGPLGDLKVSASYFLPLLMDNAEQDDRTYRVLTPVSVARGQSAMVPILDATLSYRELFVYNGAKMANHPLRVWQIANSTGLALEQGPVTLTDAGRYVGEGIVRFTGVGDDVQIPFALEVGVLVTQDRKALERRLWAVTMDTTERRARVEWAYVTQEQYVLVSRINRVLAIQIEHRDPNGGSYEDMPPPVLAVRGHTRWVVEVPAKGEARFTVRERRIVDTLEDVATWQASYVEELRAGGGLSDSLYETLRRLLDAQRQAAEAVEQRDALLAEEQQLAVRQDQLRKNLQALGESAREAALRDRMLDDLEASEDRRRAIETTLRVASTTVQTAQAAQLALVDALYTAPPTSGTTME
jgi:hypothetical protein